VHGPLAVQVGARVPDDGVEEVPHNLVLLPLPMLAIGSVVAVVEGLSVFDKVSGEEGIFG
jgi:hypothetical protein